MAVSRPLQATALGWLLISIGHTLSARAFQTHPKFHQLPNLAYTCSKAGWFQGSAFLFMTALINHHWAHHPEALQLATNKAIAALATAIMWVSSAWYFARGVKQHGMLVAGIGALQAWAAFSGVN